ncbi:glycosyltransferase involved in cell wall biosynthesis [Ruminiclostridium sufflavum DSM 19573]|uniref:Glycosyltransferase involved in cell wall biosynthesis n=1 Tax=Ruminiclostridium sufflavum DSM 19573 TaxID=1121337 RepID=A0A318YCM3_9FIRM|nr:glycosyltransferase family 2 protein [Ruminiclostridium sufflavum]PYG90362.1 glycosyltransferase involved in cell wall biosynthesis [Ruminiclostridium sufflavum DSM 19573]
MKVLTIVIPCYNSAAYMERAVESLLVGSDELDILIIDDGSSDNTAVIADEYEKKYPNIIRAIHKKNGGHGDVINTGLKYAEGIYFKVLDSDDWFDKDSLKKVLDILKAMLGNSTVLDMLITNYVYENMSIGKSRSINYKNAMPEEKIFTWNDLGYLKSSQNILMHSVIYRTEVLKSCGLELPKHTFYVDNIFVYMPLPYVNTMYYANLDLYRYFIGRTDQSVNEKIMIQRIDQQIRVTKLMIDCYNPIHIECKKLRKYMIKYLVMMMTVSTVLLLKDNTEQSLNKKKELWQYLRFKDQALYDEVDNSLLGSIVQFKGYLGRKIILLCYSLSRKIFGFN